MLSSGTVAKATAGAASVVLISATRSPYNHLEILNEGAAPGFFSVDGGVSWGRIPAAIPPYSGAAANVPGSVEWWGSSTQDVLIKRDAADMSGVYGTADWLEP